MAFNLTQNALNALNENSIELNIVFQIEDVITTFGAVPIKKFVRIGDEGLEIGDPEINTNAFYIGNFNLLANQKTLISFDGTTTTIKQQLQIDRGKSSGVSNFQVTLIDQDEFVTNLITPDETQSPTFDVLGRRCSIYIGFANTSFPDDYIKVFRGAITDVEPGAGTVRFSINSPDNKKRKTLFKDKTTELSSAMGAGDTVANVDSTNEFLVKITPPGGGLPVDEFKTYIQIDDEIIEYQTTNATQFQTLTRGALGTTAASHSIDANVSKIYQITGNVIDIALRIMLSGFNGDFVEDIEVSNFNVISPTESQDDVLFFSETNIVDQTGIVVGDYITTTGATNGANNVSEALVTGITVDGDNNTIITVSGAGFVDEIDTAALMSIRSQYDVFPDGMKMLGDEVDIDQHLFLKNTFLPSFEYDFRVDEQIDDGKEWLEEKVYSPIAAFSVPRKAKASVGYHIGPIPGQNIKTFNKNNLRNPDDLRIRRSTERFFYNEIIYRFDKVIGEDKYLTGLVTINQDSKNRIKSKEKALTIDADGLTSALSGINIATQSSNRRIDRYKFGAEFMDVRPFFATGFQVEIGDIVLLNGEDLSLTDIKNGSREFQTRLMEVEQKTLNVRNGDVKIQLVDTNFDGQQRFGLISPSSNIKSGISTTQFIIEESFGSRFGDNEFQKYDNFVQPFVRIRSLDFTTRNETVQVANFSGNTVTLKTALSFTPQPGDVMELNDYSAQPLEVTLVFASISDNAGDDFADLTSTYVIL